MAVPNASTCQPELSKHIPEEDCKKVPCSKGYLVTPDQQPRPSGCQLGEHTMAAVLLRLERTVQFENQFVCAPAEKFHHRKRASR